MRIFTYIFITVTVLFPASAFAATAAVRVDTGGEEINALEATLVLPESIHVSRIETGNSTILMWITKPRQEGREITFAGITPGGFSGVQLLLTLHGAFYPADFEKVRFQNVVALKNDGSGTRIPVAFSFDASSFQTDSEPPEDFTPRIVNDPNLFDGKYSLVFAAQDKNSGVNRYEVREGRFGPWREVDSPHILANQKLNRNIYVRAKDHANNERVAVVPAVHRAWWEMWAILAILIVLTVAVGIYKKTWARFVG